MPSRVLAPPGKARLRHRDYGAIRSAPRPESNVRPVSIARHMCLGVDTHVFRGSGCGKGIETPPAHRHQAVSTDVCVGRQVAGG
jgi:hypothetical protein